MTPLAVPFESEFSTVPVKSQWTAAVRNAGNCKDLTLDIKKGISLV